MKKSSLIGHIVELLDLVRSRQRSADSLIAEFFRSRHYLGSKDRRFIADAVYGVLRNYLLLDAHIASAHDSMSLPSRSEPPLPLELYAAYARTILKEEPAAITADIDSLWSVDRPAVDPGEFLDAVGRPMVPPADADTATRISLTYSMPQVIVREWLDRLGEEEADRLCAACNLPAPTTIRVNTLRNTVDQCQSRLLAEGIETTRTLLSPVGLSLKKRVNVHALQSFREGAFEMQDEGSQLLSLLLEPVPDFCVVDACAGAGGKTLHIAALMHNRGSVLAIDSERRRLDIMRQRAERAGVSIVQARVVGEEQIERWKDRADAVLVDAPCTGVGTFRRNPGAKLEFDRHDLHAITGLQLTILAEYGRLVKPGGRLVYATCSLLAQENEKIVEQFQRFHPRFRPLSASEILARQGVVLPSSSPFLTLLPHRTQTDGFFAAAFEKLGGN